jgi:hypothetical protein
LQSGGFWCGDSDGVHLLSPGIEGNGWDFPLIEADVISFFEDPDIEHSTDTRELDISLELLGPEVGEVLTVVDTILYH